MQSSPVSWEERELAQVLPKIPTSLCVFCHEVIGIGPRHSADDVADRQEAAATVSRRTRGHRRHRRCFPGLARPSPDIRSSGSGKSTVSRESTSKLAENARKSGDNLSSSSSSASSLSLYTSDSSDEELDKDDRLSTTSSCSFPYDQPAETVSLPPDYLSKFSSLQDWLAKRKSLRNAMGSKGDITRWLQNKKKRTPLEERVLALIKLNSSSNQKNQIRSVSSIQAVKCGAAKSGHSLTFKRSRHDDVEHEHLAGVSRTQSIAADIGRDLSEGSTSSHHEIFQSTDRLMSGEFSRGELLDTRTRSTASDALSPSDKKSYKSPEIAESTERMMSNESCSGELVSVLDEYLKQRRVRLLDLFRCVDVSRSGKCSRKDFSYLLKLAKVPLTQVQVEQLADSLAVDDHPDCLDYSRLAVAMDRHSEMRLFRKRRDNDGVDSRSTSTADVSHFSSLLMKAGGSDADQTAATACQEVRENDKASCEDQKRSHCRRVVKLFRDNALFGQVSAGKTSSSSARGNVVAGLKSTLDDDEGLATRLEEIRLRDRIEYEATRNAIRRQRLPVPGRTLRRGLLSAADRPHSTIDIRRLPRTHVLGTHNDSGHTETQIRTQHDSDDSLDREMEEDEQECASDRSATASASSSRLGLRVRSATTSKHLHSASFTPRSEYDRLSQQGSTLGLSGSGEMSEEEDEEDKEEENDGKDDGGAGKRWSTRATGRPSWPRTRHDLAWRRMMWELEEERARKNAIYWPGRADHVRVYRTEGDRGGHPIFERVGQTWYNDDPRYLAGRSDDEAVERYHCRRSFQRHSSHWT